MKQTAAGAATGGEMTQLLLVPFSCNSRGGANVKSVSARESHSSDLTAPQVSYLRCSSLAVRWKFMSANAFMRTDLKDPASMNAKIIPTPPTLKCLYDNHQSVNAVYLDNHTKHTNSICRENVELLIPTVSGMNTYHKGFERAGF